MKRKVLYPAMILFVLAVVSCKKDNSPINPGNGKWQETKITMYETQGSAAKLYETTFTQPFNNADFAEFSDSSTFNIGVGHYYYMNTPGSPVNSTQQITPTVGVWKFTALGNNKYVLSTATFNLNPGGFQIADTVTIVNPHLLWLHAVGYTNESGNQNITDAYYSR